MEGGVWVREEEKELPGVGLGEGLSQGLSAHDRTVGGR